MCRASKLNLHDYLVESLEPRRLCAAGDLDTTFSGNGKHLTGNVTSSGGIDAMVLQADGKLIIGSSQDSQDGEIEFFLQRFTAEGDIDTTFDPQIPRIDGMFQSTDDLAIGPDGKIYLVGSEYNGLVSSVVIYRLKKNGSLDDEFGGQGDGKVVTDLDATSAIGSIVVQRNGKIVVGGTTNNDFVLQRFRKNGTVDDTFGQGDDGMVAADFSAFDSLNDLKIDAQGRLVAVGSNANDFAIARFTANGLPDTTFDTDGKVTVDFGDSTSAESVDFLPGRGLVAIGTTLSGMVMARLNENGSLIDTFGEEGKVQTDLVGFSGGFDVAFQTNGRIVAGVANAGPGIDGRFLVARFKKNGAIDESFGDGGTVATLFVNPGSELTNIAITPKGRIIAVGADVNDDSPTSDYYRGAIAAYESESSGQGILLEDGILTINGTAGDDVITIQRNDNKIVSRLNSTSQEFRVSQIDELLLNGFGGNDRITIAKDVEIETVIEGASGDDILTGGAVSDHIFGGKGADQLTGRKGRDTLEGGSGADVLLAEDKTIDELLGGKGDDESENDNIDIRKSIESPDQ